MTVLSQNMCLRVGSLLANHWPRRPLQRWGSTCNLQQQSRPSCLCLSCMSGMHVWQEWRACHPVMHVWHACLAEMACLPSSHSVSAVVMKTLHMYSMQSKA
jgi:hypothetical protein